MKGQINNSMEWKFIKAYSMNFSIWFYSTALCKLGPQKQFSKKWKMNDF